MSLDYDAAVGFVRDVLEEAGPYGDFILAGVLGGRSTIPKVAGPLVHGGTREELDGQDYYVRHSLHGALGALQYGPSREDGAVEVWYWTIGERGTGERQIRPPYGEHATIAGADAAFAEALRGFGWACMATPEAWLQAFERAMADHLRRVRAPAQRYIVDGDPPQMGVWQPPVRETDQTTALLSALLGGPVYLYRNPEMGEITYTWGGATVTVTEVELVEQDRRVMQRRLLERLVDERRRMPHLPADLVRLS